MNEFNIEENFNEYTDKFIKFMDRFRTGDRVNELLSGLDIESLIEIYKDTEQSNEKLFQIFDELFYCNRDVLVERISSAEFHLHRCYRNKEDIREDIRDSIEDELEYHQSRLAEANEYIFDLKKEIDENEALLKLINFIYNYRDRDFQEASYNKKLELYKMDSYFYPGRFLNNSVIEYSFDWLKKQCRKEVEKRLVEEFIHKYPYWRSL